MRAKAGQLIGVLLAAGIVLVVIILVSRAGTDEAPPAAERVGLFDGLPQDGPWLGRPDAPVVVEEVLDLQCPFCAEFAADDLPALVRDRVRTGQVRLRLRVLTFLGPESVTAGRAAVAAGLQDRQWPFVEAVLAQQGAENSGWVTGASLRRAAGLVPGLDAERLLADAGRRATVDPLLAADRRAAREGGVEGTPSFRVGRRDGPLRTVDPGGLDAAIADALPAGS